MLLRDEAGRLNEEKCTALVIKGLASANLEYEKDDTTLCLDGRSAGKVYVHYRFA